MAPRKDGPFVPPVRVPPGGWPCSGGVFLAKTIEPPPIPRHTPCDVWTWEGEQSEGSWTYGEYAGGKYPKPVPALTSAAIVNGRPHFKPFVSNKNTSKNVPKDPKTFKTFKNNY